MKLLRRGTAFTLTAIVCLYFSLALADVRVFFSPKGGCTDAVINEIERAEHSIDVAMYAFTSRPIAQAIARAYKRGVKVRIVLDKSFAQKARFSKHIYLIKRGIPVKLVSPPQGPGGRRGLMHHKFAIIDDKVLITGSFNWTAAAERLNYENLLVFYSSRMAKIYKREFEKLWKR